MVILFAAQLSQATKVIPFEVEPLKGLLPPREETVEDEILEEFFYQKLGRETGGMKHNPNASKKTSQQKPMCFNVCSVFLSLQGSKTSANRGLISVIF